MAKLGIWGHCCLIYSLAAVLFLGWLTILAAFDPVRIKIIGPGEHHDIRVVRGWTSSGVATFVGFE